MRLLARMAAALAVVMVMFAPVTAQADEVFWTINNQTSSYIDFKFYVYGTNLAWPGDGGTYTVYSGESHEQGMTCEAGAQICFGAWADGDVRRRWGLGASAKNTCKKCCITCENGRILSNSLTD